MLAYDIFSSNSFQATEIQQAVGNIVYIPETISTLGIFEVEPLRTTTVGIYKKNEGLALVPFTPRGAPETLPERDARSLVQLEIPRNAQRDRINSHELQNIVNEFMPFDTALMNAEDEVDNRLAKLMRKMEITRAYQQLGALQGLLLDADASVYMNFYTQFGISQPAPIVFDFTNAFNTTTEGALRTYIANNVVRPMMRQLNSRKTANTRIMAFCGDTFFDKFIATSEVRKTYLNYAAASDLRESKVWQQFDYGGVTWVNFQGTDDNTTIAIPTNGVIFFPVGATDVFKEYRAPGEGWDQVNQLAQQFYAAVSPDYRPNMMQWVDLYLFNYTLFACIGPDVLLRGTAT
jgi:hypothetical protein